MSSGRAERDRLRVVPPPPAPVCDPDPATGRCATCADEAVEGRVLGLGEDDLADVEMDGAVRTVAIELLEGVRAGDVVLVHAGVAIARVEGGGTA